MAEEQIREEGTVKFAAKAEMVANDFCAFLHTGFDNRNEFDKIDVIKTDDAALSESGHDFGRHYRLSAVIRVR